ncbi:SWIM zinc finger family protein [Streptomyces sp. NBC_00102]|uniref:SWIM zinc finger family protein n=1 Tax=Streptomyces sp. NBC_00102 TaxID=2975652 RepID=UPI0022586ECA|nr:SWIM zinc finger family protein [Streptomyces sp. NBC_00102]MCX5399220.1 SWIM zinc finger family protein [Streptomyces sp. NBC_00102]
MWPVAAGFPARSYPVMVPLLQIAHRSVRCVTTVHHATDNRSLTHRHRRSARLSVGGPNVVAMLLSHEGESARTADRAGRAPAAPADAEAARKRAERRSARIADGARELEERLADLLRSGLAVSGQSGGTHWEETAARMVDAQAPGLASRVRELGALPASGAGWPARMLEECGLLHLLNTAWLDRDRLPPSLLATVRTRVGLSSAADGRPVRDRWQVLAQYDTPDGKIVTRRIWLYGEDSGRTLVLLSYGAGGRAPERSLPVGTVLEAELTPHPGAGHRAEPGAVFGTPDPAAAPPPGVSPAEALAGYGRALGEDPWAERHPAVLGTVIPVPSAGRWQLADERTGTALPIAGDPRSRPGLWRLAALSGGGPVTVFGELGPRGFAPLTAWSAGEGGGHAGGEGPVETVALA